MCVSSDVSRVMLEKKVHRDSEDQKEKLYVDDSINIYSIHRCIVGHMYRKMDT